MQMHQERHQFLHFNLLKPPFPTLQTIFCLASWKPLSLQGSRWKRPCCFALKDSKAFALSISTPSRSNDSSMQLPQKIPFLLGSMVKLGKIILLMKGNKYGRYTRFTTKPWLWEEYKYKLTSSRNEFSPYTLLQTNMAMENPPFYVGNASSTGPISTAMLVYWSAFFLDRIGKDLCGSQATSWCIKSSTSLETLRILQGFCKVSSKGVVKNQPTRREREHLQNYTMTATSKSYNAYN